MRPETIPGLDAETTGYLLGNVKASEPDHLAALPYYPETQRAGALALIAFTAELRGVPLRVSEPMLGQIRLQWWRDALGEIYGEGHPRQHPLVLALATTIGQRPELRSTLGKMIDETARFLAPVGSTDPNTILDDFAVHDGGLSVLLMQWVKDVAGPHDLARQMGAQYGLLRGLTAVSRPAQAPANPQGIQTAIERLRQLPGHADLRAQTRLDLQTAWRAAIPLPQNVAPVFAAMKLGRAYSPTRPPADLARRTRLFLTILRGR